ncbi:LysR family transcriptional regulator [Mesobacillus maritimus]|uniref:LysR family transcriptional regulator n=1 Tax=Mesobacillus maritimus TaxID=1643336 RepID=UPI00203FFC13|nr:LysR family transcriptional regulator [Mesobacillus maritimus]MCM3584443.1 LysR family transcriptional regulator [Mesobacillus maritimus]MCM3670824.1 LysR family transcriptional regulator [Mesobacillus maritimus]
MDFRQLRYFIAIAEEKNITAAANRLHMSQPPLSMQLKQLEEELGVKLVERNGKSMALTDKGEVLYRHALQLVNNLEEVKNELQETEEGRKGTLSVGLNTLSVPFFSDMLQKYHQKYPHVSLKVVQNDSFYLTDMVKSRSIEMAFVRLPLEHQGLAYHHLLNDPFVFVYTKSIESISLKEITEFPLIIPSTEGLGSYNTILNAFSKQQLQPKIIAECSDMHVLMEMVRAGMGATIVPESVLKVYGGLHLFPTIIRDADLFSSLGIIWLEHHFISTPAKNFMEIVKKVLGN